MCTLSYQYILGLNVSGLSETCFKWLYWITFFKYLDHKLINYIYILASIKCWRIVHYFEYIECNNLPCWTSIIILNFNFLISFIAKGNQFHLLFWIILHIACKWPLKSLKHHIVQLPYLSFKITNRSLLILEPGFGFIDV